VPATATYSVTGDSYVDGLLSGVKWGVTNLTFSFPQESSFYGTSYGSGEHLNNFEAFTATQQDAVRKILQMYSAVTNIGFTEVVETSSVHGDLRYAESDSTGTAWAYYPSTSAAGGDAWFNNSKNYYDNPKVGNYGWLTMMHETGHALGLKHPHEARGTFGAMPADKDSLEYSVMSYRSYIGASTTSGYTNGSTSYPQTLMMYDIAALQKMYGANYGTNAGDTVYRWSAATGEMSINGIGQGAPAGNKIFITLWDGGGVDTYDFSNYTTNLSVDLNPGGWTTASTTQLASLGSGKLAAGNIANALLFNGNTASLIENVVGGSGADTISGNATNNVLTGGRGNDILDGRGGTDTAVYSGNQADYSWLRLADDTWSITDLRSGSPDGTDQLKGIEYLRFLDSLFELAAPQEPSDPPIVPDDPPLVNTAPVALNDTYTTARSTKLVVKLANSVLKNDADADGDALTASLVSGPSKGKLVFRADGSFDYTPLKNFTGTVSFTYRATDGEDNSNLATVAITVGASGVNARRGGAEHHRHDLHDAAAPAGGADALLAYLTQLAAGSGPFSGGPSKYFGLHGNAFTFHVPGYHGDDVRITGLPDSLKLYAPDFIFQ
jgi:serralysin